MQDKRFPLTNVLIAVLILVTALGIVQNMSKPLDGTVAPMSMEPRYVQGFAADGSAAAGNPVQVGGKDSGGLAQSLSIGTDGALHSAPFAAIAETGAVELIGVDEQAAQYDWFTGTQVALGGTYSGEVLNITLILSGTLSEAGTLVIFDADPSVTLADANLATASWLLAIGKVDVAAGDWFEENSGGTGGVATFAEPIAFHALSSFWVGYYHEGATQWNSAAGDNETLDIQIEYRRDS